MIADATAQMMRAAVDGLVAADMEWTRQDRHGRWVVIERGVGALLKDSPPSVREYVDGVTSYRARRFSSLSRARKFAQKVDGIVRRWRRRPPARGGGGKFRRVWRRQGPWERALQSAKAMRMLPCMLRTISEDE